MTLTAEHACLELSPNVEGLFTTRSVWKSKVEQKKRIQVMNSDRVLGLFRFGKRNYIEEFVHDGLLYMNPLKHFLALENDAVRSDRNEGAEFAAQPDQVKLRMQVDGIFQDISGICGPVMFHSDEQRKANVFCMYALRASKAFNLIDPRNYQFGDTYVLFKDGDEFFRRLRLAIESIKLPITWGMVEYVDRKSFHGPMGVFRKFSDFDYQSELRVVRIPGTGEPFSFRIGDLSDISCIGNLSDLNDHLKVE